MQRTLLSLSKSGRRLTTSVCVVIGAGILMGARSAAPFHDVERRASTPSVRPRAPHRDRALVADSLRDAIRRRLETQGLGNDHGPGQWKRLQTLYQTQQHRPLWIDTSDSAGAHALRPRAAELLESIVKASEHGLVAGRYYEVELHAALRVLQRRRSSAEILAHADVLLTAAFVSYVTDMLIGQIVPQSVNRDWHIDTRDVDIDSALVRSLRDASFQDALLQLSPRNDDYARLKDALARYRGFGAGGSWPQVRSPGVLRPGDTTTAELLGLLAARLHVEGYDGVLPLVPAPRSRITVARAIVGPGSRVLYDARHAGVVADFQRRHGLAVDSVVGPGTLAAINRPLEFRQQQIAANLERHRWLPRTRGDRYVVVNVPAFRLRAYDGGREVLSMNVVVGAEYDGRATPAFSDSMSHIVFKPYWNVPVSIANRELWPMQRRDPGYFRRNGYEVARASWGRYVRQRPSPGNALGRAKFIFPNDFDIYLHDTPAQALFAERVRAFSHGCIRVEHPDQLSAFVLGPQGWDLDRVREAMSTGEDDHRVDLDRKLPVYIVYFTTYVREGALHFGTDIYGRDDALVRAMQDSAPPGASDGETIDRLRDVTRALFDAT